MSEPSDYEHVTTQAKVDIYHSSAPIFEGILGELRELSKKKPEATMSLSKVSIVNRVLADLLDVLKEEPDAKYLQPLDSDALPQVSDAVLVMVQFETALKSFKRRYYQRVSGDLCWITSEFIKEWEDELVEGEEEEGEEEEEEEEG
jgi:hypothetical protein